MKWPKVLYAHDDSEIPVVRWLRTTPSDKPWDGVGYRSVKVQIGKKVVTGYAHFLAGKLRFKRVKAKVKR